MQREKPPEWREKQKGSRGIRRGQRYRLVFQFPIRERAGKIAQYEQTFGVTVSRKKIDVIDLGSAVAPIQISDVEALEQVSREDYTLPIFVPEGQKWVLPGGAFGREACGSD
ncbi:hypothetical protein ECO9455_11631 [Escherichia coli O111:H11 str. CVM9455]|nr:hypothetical protein ECO9455_11631 [Escherichia coli O111:H11 str. CVM9455]